jgi:hypothetical protein
MGFTSIPSLGDSGAHVVANGAYPDFSTCRAFSEAANAAIRVTVRSRSWDRDRDRDRGCKRREYGGAEWCGDKRYAEKQSRGGKEPRGHLVSSYLAAESCYSTYPV